jgi:hypothetical protein
MRHCDDQVTEAAGILFTKVWYLVVWTAKDVPDDGKAA